MRNLRYGLQEKSAHRFNTLVDILSKIARKVSKTREFKLNQQALFKKFSKSILIVSYSSNSQPTQDEMVALMAKHKVHVEVIPIDYTYSFGNQKEAKTNRNKVQEFLFVGF